MRLASVLSILALSACAAATEPVPDASSTVAPALSFDPAEAWDEFEALLRERYAYLDAMGRDAADAQLARSRVAALEASSPAAARRVMHQTALTFADPHLLAGPLGPDDWNVVMTSADLDVAYEDDAFVVADVRAGSAADGAGVRPGWTLLAADGVPTARAARLPFGPVLPVPSPRQLAYGATLAANGRRGQDRRVLTFARPDGAAVDVVLASPRVQARALLDAPPVATSRLGAEGGIGLVRFNNSLGRDETIAAFDEAVRALSDTHALILDLRDTPSGGNTEVARSVIGHFVDEPRAYQMHTIPAVERASGVPRRFVELVEPRVPRYDGPIVVLHGRWTGSMGEGLVIGLDAAAGAHTIGSDMGDLLGALWSEALPASGARVEFGGEALFTPEGLPREDYVADRPLASADRDAGGGDPAMRAALAYLDGHTEP